MRRKLLYLLFVAPAILYPLVVYLELIPGLQNGFDLNSPYTSRPVVTHVDEGTPVAKAGLRVGDIVLSKNGIPIRYSGASFVQYFASPEDTVFVLEYERDGQRHKLNFQAARFRSRGEVAFRFSAVFLSFLVLVVGLLLWFAGKGSAPAELAGAYFILFGLGGFDPGTMASLGPRLRLYPLGEVAFVVASLGAVVQMACLTMLGNVIPKPRLTSTKWKLFLGVYTGFWCLANGAWAIMLLDGTLPDWLQYLTDWGGTAAAISYVAAALVLLFLNYRSATDLNDRRRIRILIAGLAPCVVGMAFIPVVQFLPLRTIFLVLIPIVSSFFLFPVSVAYALLRHRLFDIRVILRRGLQYALARGSLVVLILIPLAGVLVHLYQNRGRSIGEVLSANAVLYLLAGALLAGMLAKRQKILKELDRRFFREAYDPREVHLEIARLLAKRDDVERDSRQLTAVLVRALHAGYGALLLRSKSSGPYRASFLLPGETGETPFPAGETPAVPSGSRLPGLLELTGKPLETDLADPRSFLRQLPQADQDLVGSWKAGLLAPVGETTVEAMLVLGEKLSEQPYSAEDIKLVEAVGLDLTAAYFSTAATRQRAGERMRECPRCGTCFPEDAERCANDGAALVDSALSSAIAGRYRLIRRLGAGGMGVVYLATDAELGRQVAVKVIRPDSLTHENALERFRREARSAASLSHPNVVAVHDFGTLAGGGAFLVMEYLEGQTLREMLRSEGSLAGPAVLEILDGVVAALDNAHRTGMVHRDLKPENVMVSRDSSGRGRIKVLDFGLAKNIAADQETLTESGHFAGTLAYMAPEQLHGGTIDARTDIYALAVMSHEMLVGRRPENGRVSNGGFREVLERALERRAESRQPNVGEFYQALKRSLGSQ